MKWQVFEADEMEQWLSCNGFVEKDGIWSKQVSSTLKNGGVRFDDGRLETLRSAVLGDCFPVETDESNALFCNVEIVNGQDNDVWISRGPNGAQRGEKFCGDDLWFDVLAAIATM